VVIVSGTAIDGTTVVHRCVVNGWKYLDFHNVAHFHLRIDRAFACIA
jgi:hypothetical protein